jgi:hypothetical protein
LAIIQFNYPELGTIIIVPDERLLQVAVGNVAAMLAAAQGRAATSTAVLCWSPGARNRCDFTDWWIPA